MRADAGFFGEGGWKFITRSRIDVTQLGHGLVRNYCNQAGLSICTLKNYMENLTKP